MRLSRSAVEYVRTIIIVAALVVGFVNLIDSISQSAPWFDYAFYVGPMFGMVIVLLVVKSHFVVCGVLGFAGIIMIFTDQAYTGISAGVLMLIFSIRLSKSFAFRIAVYICTFIAVAASHISKGCTPADAINNVFMYAVFYLIDYIIDTEIADEKKHN